jgi:hypothetical protein
MEGGSHDPQTQRQKENHMKDSTKTPTLLTPEELKMVAGGHSRGDNLKGGGGGGHLSPGGHGGGLGQGGSGGGGHAGNHGKGG